MPLDIETFVRIRPYAYHLTSRMNLDFIFRARRIDSAAALIQKDGRIELLRRRRLEHESVRVDGHEISLRDQAPLHRGNIALSGGWNFEDLVEALNSRVFFWPGTWHGANDYGCRHFRRYAAEAPVLIRVRTDELLDANTHSAAEFCLHNSGAPRYSGGRPSPRGPDTFVAASRFPGTASKVVEVAFRDVVVLPAACEVGSSPEGPWSATSMHSRRAV